VPTTDRSQSAVGPDPTVHCGLHEPPHGSRITPDTIDVVTGPFHDIDAYPSRSVAYSTDVSRRRSVGETSLTSAFTCATPPERPIPAADHALVDGLQRLPGNKRPNQTRQLPTGHRAALRAHAASSACRPRAMPLRFRARAGSERRTTANTAHHRQVSLARRILAGQRLPATARTGSSFGLCPALEIHPAPRPHFPCSTLESCCVWVRVSEPP
jgi:hypothetical protein